MSRKYIPDPEEPPEHYDDGYYYHWLLLTNRIEDDFVRLRDQFTEEHKKGTYDRKKALRMASISMTKSFNDLVEINDPDFVPKYFEKAKKEVAERFLDRVEHEVKWNIGEFKPLPIEEILTPVKKFDTPEEALEWEDRLRHTHNISNLIQCQETGWKYPNPRYRCDDPIPFPTKKNIEAFKTKYADKLKLGKELSEKFEFVNPKYEDDAVCIFEPNLYNPEFVFGLCIKPRTKTNEGTIRPPRAELVSFSRRNLYSDENGKWVSQLDHNDLPTDEKKKPSVLNVRYTNERNFEQAKRGHYRDSPLIHFDEGEFKRDLRDLVTEHQIEDLTIRETEREQSRLTRKGTDISKEEFWTYPSPDDD